MTDTPDVNALLTERRARIRSTAATTARSRNKLGRVVQAQDRVKSETGAARRAARTKRDAEIVDAAALGIPRVLLAGVTGLTPERIRQIVADGRIGHYHEVYFNEHTSDGPRVGATRRFKAEIIRDRSADRRAGRFVHPNAVIVYCGRPDSQCPWTVDGMPGEERT